MKTTRKESKVKAQWIIIDEKGNPHPFSNADHEYTAWASLMPKYVDLWGCSPQDIIDELKADGHRAERVEIRRKK
jgi:hypothetical protein